jgi:hypothetical protein
MAHRAAIRLLTSRRRLVTGLITESGVAEASREGLLGLFPERRSAA